MKVKKRLSLIIVFVILVGFSIFYLGPFLWMILTALKPNSQIFLYPPKFIPDPPMFGNFLEAVQTIPFFRYTLNSFLVSVLATAGALFSCPLAAYSLARLRWKGRNALFIITLAVMMIPTQVTMVPLFIVFSKMKLVGTYFPLVLPMFFGVP